MVATTSYTSEGHLKAAELCLRNKAKDEMEAGRIASMFGVGTCINPEIAKMAAVAGFPAVYMNLEHWSVGLENMQNMCIGALNSGITPIVVTPDGSSAWVSRALDCGAMGVIVPRSETVEQVKEIVKYSKFRPIGERPLSTAYMMRYSRVPSLAKEFQDIINERILTMPMIETVLGLENVEAIAAIPGVDCLFVGSWDLLDDMGHAGEYDNPKLLEAYEKIAAAADKASVNGRKVFVGCGGLEPRPDIIRILTKKHPCIRLFMAGRDSVALLNGMKAEVAGFKALAEKIGA
ncbi:hypothetical protein MNV49_001260 [Pseudohyphozyma bogoriensis]|nr:hypothetical protein MNV49_001260 [Pseudohyphozyma bogoriensis]